MPAKKARQRAIMAAIAIDEERVANRARAAEREAKLDKLSPPCANAWKLGGKGRGRKCGHKLNVHEPCSKCGCAEFVGANGETAAAATAALAAAHPDLYPKVG